jgi:hypothetical protein
MKGLSRTEVRGQSLFEVVLALAVIALIVIGVVALATNSIKNTTFSKNKTLATKYAQEANEWLRGQRDENISIFRSRVVTPFWCLPDLNWGIKNPCSAEDVVPQTLFVRNLSFLSSVEANKLIITATITVAWGDAAGYHEVKTITYFTDWRER